MTPALDTQSIPLRLASFALLAGLLVYPFSIAGSNFFFVIVLIASLYAFDIIKAGWNICWTEYRKLTTGIVLFIGITFVGTLWSEYNALAFHKMGKQIHWLLIPIIIGLVYHKPDIRVKAFIALSVGMFAHLVTTTLQFFNLIHIDKLGSGVDDATGFLGHLAFGFIYGIWAGALLVASRQLPKTWRYTCYALSLYSVIMVFLAQGRSGYMTTFACLVLVIFKVFYPKQLKLKLAIVSLLILGLALFVAQHGPTQAKLKRTVSGVSAFLDGDWQHAEIRLKIWETSIEIWKEHPWLGVGTAGYPDAAKEILAKPKMDYLNIDPAVKHAFYGHPHHEFLFALSRWGPIGLLILLYLCWQWIATGWQKDWQHDTMNAYFITASGISVVLHGLTEPSLNTHLETVFAIISLGFGMSKPKQAP